MALPTAKDEITGVPVSRITSGAGTHLLPYYTANALSADGRWCCCTYDGGGTRQAWVYDMTTGQGRAVSNAPGGVLAESVAFHPTRALLCFATPDGVFRHDLDTGRTDELYRCAEGFAPKSEISLGREHVVFWVYEQMDPGRPADGQPPRGFHMFRCCRSYILAVQIDTGSAEVVWGETAPLTHPVISPTDENLVLYANQGPHERLQELFTIARADRDDRKPRKLYACSEQRPVYVGHSFFTRDGWVAAQIVEFGGRRADGSLSDRVSGNAIIRPDGLHDRRARCPGGNKPMHAHAAHADSWWVGDSLPAEGANDPHMLCVMKNNWETGHVQAEPLAAHGCTSERPHHVHPRFSGDEKLVLFNSDFSGHCQVYAAHVQEYLAAWTDRAPFEPRRWRDCIPPIDQRRAPRHGPRA